VFYASFRRKAERDKFFDLSEFGVKRFAGPFVSVIFFIFAGLFKVLPLGILILNKQAVVI